ncbi:MAG: acriflavine resistance protein B [Planctomycetes bacterium]|nr:acriflavine resistance protein B [Planctomycetota bacterium]
MSSSAPPRGPIATWIRFCLENPPVVFLLTLFVLGWGLRSAPFDWPVGSLVRDPVAVDAIPDIGENQQIVFTRWPGRSPQDVEDQVTYPLTVALLGIPDVRTIRSHSYLGFSSIHVIFEDSAEFYASRTRVLEKLASLAPDTLPPEVTPTLGPDATALGQVFWYTLEGRDPDGQPAAGWDLDELRTIQDWTVRNALASARGVSEVASVGGFVREVQIDVDPDAMRAYDVSLQEVFRAVGRSNLDVGARTIEVNRVEYVIRGLGFLESLEDVESTVIKTRDDVPTYVRDVARVALGPALRRGALDRAGAEAVGGVVVARHGFNPLEAIAGVRHEIEELAPALPRRALIDRAEVGDGELEAFSRAAGLPALNPGGADEDVHGAWCAWIDAHADERPGWLSTSRVTIVPFYDRTGLIHETLDTLERALIEEVLVAAVVVLAMLMHLPSSLLISAILPLSVLMCFIAMRAFGVDANVVALSGIAIAIGTMVDMGIILCENILRHLEEADEHEPSLEVVFRATSEVGGAVVTAVATTVLGFLPVFTLTATEGKLFKPLAFTKSFALIAATVTALSILPPAAHFLFTRGRRPKTRRLLPAVLLAGAVGLAAWGLLWAGLSLALVGVYTLVRERLGAGLRKALAWSVNAAAIAALLVVLTRHWRPLGPGRDLAANLLFVGASVGGVLGFFTLVRLAYPTILAWCLRHKLLFLSSVGCVLLTGLSVWLGFERVFSPVPQLVARAGGDGEKVRRTAFWVGAHERLPGLGREFMPRFDEGSFLFMPTTMPHASLEEALDVLRIQDEGIASIPEVESVVGKIGRVDSALDPAPVSMVETVINYKSEFGIDAAGKRVRQWRDHIRTAEDIWSEVVAAAEVVGSTSAPLLQPIETRLIMLQTGMRAPMGIKVKGPDLESIERMGLELERALRDAPGVAPATLLADRIVGKPYLEIDLDRERLARYGLHIEDIQDVIEVAIGGRRVTTTVEGRERYPVRVRYLRERRDDIEALSGILVPTRHGAQIPLAQLAEVRAVRGPQVIKSEDTALVGYVTFGPLPGHTEVDVVEACQAYLADLEERGELERPPGVSYAFTGTYEHQVRAQATLAIVLPGALLAILLILYLQFRRMSTALLVFSGVAVAWAGGFLLLWAWAQPGFASFDIGGTDLREVFGMGTVNLSVAVWVGFLALFGIASDDGVVIATYLGQSFRERAPTTIAEARAATLAAGTRRVRPCVMTTATTVLALLPVLTATGRGSGIMVPMALPTVGGMVVALLTMFVVPVSYCLIEEWRLRRR